MNQFGERVRQLREANKLLQRQVASHLEIDTPMLSKIERGERKAKKEQVNQFAKLFKIEEKELQALWLADKVLNLIEDEESASEAIQQVSTKLTVKSK